MLLDHEAMVEHRAYWASVHSVAEAAYLAAVLNSVTVVAKISDLQGIGEAGDKRDFDNLIWTLPIPEYDEADPVHRDLAAAGTRATALAEAVPLDGAGHFTAKRRAIRAALEQDGVAGEIEALVDALLPP